MKFKKMTLNWIELVVKIQNISYWHASKHQLTPRYYGFGTYNIMIISFRLKQAFCYKLAHGHSCISSTNLGVYIALHTSLDD
jgi:hypothetical protein